MAEEYTKLSPTLTLRSTVGPVNCLLFIYNATLLVSGGDDQIVRIWDVQASKCLQELVDPLWGQITALSWLPEQLDRRSVLFIGTGRGMVSLYPFSAERTQFVCQASTNTPVFRLDDSVEVQAIDPSRLRFAVASHSGQIQMFSVEDSRNLLPLWTFEVQDIPRSIFFQGERDEDVVVHTCCQGDVFFLNSATGRLAGTMKLHGGVGSAVLSADRSMKAVYNLSSGDFDVYHPADSLNPITLSVPTQTRLIKQCAFAEEDSRTLVCGGDKGTVHIFRLNGDETPRRQSWPSEGLPRSAVLICDAYLIQKQGDSTFYALTALSTLDYHFIACGESEERARIFIWRKPTQKKAAENRKFRRMQADKEIVATKVAQREREARALKEKLASMEKKTWWERCLLVIALLAFFGILNCVFWVVYLDRWDMISVGGV